MQYYLTIKCKQIKSTSQSFCLKSSLLKLICLTSACSAWIRSEVFLICRSIFAVFFLTYRLFKDSKLVTTALTTCGQTGRVFTGDSFGAIRSYNLSNEKECYYLSGPERRTAEEITAVGDSAKSIKFGRTTKDAVDVIYQFPRELKGRASSTAPYANPLSNQVNNLRSLVLGFSEIFNIDCKHFMPSFCRAKI